MIKIEITDDVENAVELHWKWMAHQFRIGESDTGLKGTEKGNFTKARNKKKELYELLGYIDSSQKSNEELVDSKDSLLKELICARPEDIIKYAHDIKENRYRHLILTIPQKLRPFYEKKKLINLIKKSDPNYKIVETDIKQMEISLASDIKDFEKKVEYGQRIKTLLNYDGLCEWKGDWNGYKLCKKVNLSICPYCNRQKISTVRNKTKWTNRPQLDHFFVKTTYPFLSCSFFNLIPSCYDCNHGKGENKTETIYPYLEEFGKNYVFRMDPKDIRDLKSHRKNPDYVYIICLDDSNVDKNPTQRFKQVKKKDDFKQLLKASNNIFHLTELYNDEQQALKELIEKYDKCRGPELDSLTKFYFKNNEEITDEQREYARRDFLGLPNKKYGAEGVCRKFKEDIIDQLDKEK